MSISPPPSPKHDTNMPSAMSDELHDLEDWAAQNLRDSRQESFRYWLLKLPALLASASAGIFAYLQWNMTALIVGALGSICVLIDGLYPSGILRNAHLRAHHDLRALQQRMTNEWRIASLEHKPHAGDQDAMAIQILKGAQEEKNRIGAYIRDVETSLGERKT